MFRACFVGGEEGEIDFCFDHRREFFFCFFCGFTQTLQNQNIFGDVDSRRKFKLTDEVIDDELIDVVAA